MKKLGKKGILGLDTVKAVIVILLAITVLVVAGILVLETLLVTSDSVITLANGTYAVNESFASMTYDLRELSANTNHRLCKVTSSVVINGTDYLPINSGNYSFNGCFIRSTTNGMFNNTRWNVSYSYIYDPGTISSMVGNVTRGETNFFTNVTTIYTLLGVVVLILIISILIAVIFKFRAEEGSIQG